VGGEPFSDPPHCQYFCGEEFFRHEIPFDRSSMTKWRLRMGGEKLEALLQESHAADPRRHIAVHALANRRYRQKPPRLAGILGPARQNPQPHRVKIVPNNNRRAHRHLPNQSVQREMNQNKARHEISESQAFRRLV
jgi:hypothetical protein